MEKRSWTSPSRSEFRACLTGRTLRRPVPCSAMGRRRRNCGDVRLTSPTRSSRVPSPAISPSNSRRSSSSSSTSRPPRPSASRFRRRLAEHGYVEGKNLIFEQRFADCRYDRMPGLAADLVQVPVDVLFTMGTRAARIVAGTVKTIPVVVYSCDPFEHVTRLARPGGNLTGVTCMTTELSPKRLELLKEAVPKASRVMFLHDPEAAPNALKLTQEAAPRLGI